MLLSLQEEETFWKELQEKYLQPLPNDKERQKKVANELRELRNKVCVRSRASSDSKPVQIS